MDGYSFWVDHEYNWKTYDVRVQIRITYSIVNSFNLPNICINWGLCIFLLPNYIPLNVVLVLDSWMFNIPGIHSILPLSIRIQFSSGHF